jgi:MFS family permease
MVTSTHRPVSAGPRRGWIVALVSATVGVAVGWFGPIQILLPAQAAALGEGEREALLALVTGAGAAASMVANPLWGALSDRLRARNGSRTPVLLMGLVLGVVGLLVLAAASTPVVMVVGWVLTQVGLNGPFAVLAALIADRVPERRRGVVGSLFGIAQLVGTIVGTALAVALGEGALGYVAVAVAVPLLVLPILLTPPGAPDVAEEPVEGEEGGAPSRRAFRVDRTFVAAFGLRFLLNLVSALGLLYLYYFLSERARIEDPGTWVLILTVCYVVVAGAAAGVAGAVSDRRGRRRGVGASAAVVLAGGAVLMAFADDIPLVVAAVVVLGVGYGLFLGVDVAIVTDALPAAGTRATLLGVANIASTLPQVLAPVIAAPIVTGAGGYLALYLAAAVVALLALFTLPFLGRIR